MKKVSKLYIQPCKNFPVKSVKDLMDSLYKEPSNLKRRKYARPTYKDKECKKLECNAGRRSFEDLLLLTRTRFPNASEKWLMKALKDINVKFYFCYLIKKVIFHFVDASYGFTLTQNNFHKVPPTGYVKGTYTAEDLSNIYKLL